MALTLTGDTGGPHRSSSTTPMCSRCRVCIGAALASLIAGGLRASASVGGGGGGFRWESSGGPAAASSPAPLHIPSDPATNLMWRAENSTAVDACVAEVTRRFSPLSAPASAEATPPRAQLIRRAYELLAPIAATHFEALGGNGLVACVATVNFGQLAWVDWHALGEALTEQSHARRVPVEHTMGLLAQFAAGACFSERNGCSDVLHAIVWRAIQYELDHGDAAESGMQAAALWRRWQPRCDALGLLDHRPLTNLSSGGNRLCCMHGVGHGVGAGRPFEAGLALCSASGASDAMVMRRIGLPSNWSTFTLCACGVFHQHITATSTDLNSWLVELSLAGRTVAECCSGGSAHCG